MRNQAALLAGRALVAGGDAGIGKGIAPPFAEQGVRVVVAELRSNAARRRREDPGSGLEAVAMTTDVRDLDQVAQAGFTRSMTLELARTACG